MAAADKNYEIRTPAETGQDALQTYRLTEKHLRRLTFQQHLTCCTTVRSDCRKALRTMLYCN